MESEPSLAAVDVLVVIPAHDESATIHACLVKVVSAIRRAQRDGLVARGRVVVAAHRCRDATASLAIGVLRDLLGEDGDYEVLVIDEIGGVGLPRHTAVSRGLAAINADLDRTWVFSTDADSLVPTDWIVHSLLIAAEAHAPAVAGMTSLHAHTGGRAARLAYEEILRRGLYVDVDGTPSHSHVYGANLAVRADAYRAVGGFPVHGHAEDQRLVDALASAGFPIARSRRLLVSTSGRTSGRAAGGLAHLLRTLENG